MNLKFSVSICVYNGDNPEYFEIAMKSIFFQTIQPDEVVLVVDGPVSEKHYRIIRKFQDNYCIKVVYLKKNVGFGNARKICLEMCTNNLIALMDADDICIKNRFEKQVEHFQKDPELSVLGGQIEEFIGSSENIVGIRTVPENNNEIKEFLKFRSPFNHMTVMFKKEDVKKVGSYKDWYLNEDYYLWIRMYLAGMKFGNCSEVLCYVRVGKEMYRRRGGIKYFQSEKKLQQYMMDAKIINYNKYLKNIFKRFVVQIILPNRIRGIVFKTFARDKKHRGEE